MCLTEGHLWTGSWDYRCVCVCVSVCSLATHATSQPCNRKTAGSSCMELSRAVPVCVACSMRADVVPMYVPYYLLAVSACGPVPVLILCVYSATSARVFVHVLIVRSVRVWSRASALGQPWHIIAVYEMCILSLGLCTCAYCPQCARVVPCDRTRSALAVHQRAHIRRLDRRISRAWPAPYGCCGACGQCHGQPDRTNSAQVSRPGRCTTPHCTYTRHWQALACYRVWQPSLLPALLRTHALLS